jgi:hypothetical protein
MRIKFEGEGTLAHVRRRMVFEVPENFDANNPRHVDMLEPFLSKGPVHLSSMNFTTYESRGISATGNNVDPSFVLVFDENGNLKDANSGVPLCPRCQKSITPA